ncbi:MAG: hypothetical protein M0Z98_00905 [Actinomycetales bacterium]|nr:hypothetical protein [Actinomycetales bacterium]
MRLHGHLVEIDWDGEVLVARGTNADGRELVNAGTPDNRLVLAPADIAEVVFRDAPRFVGGVVRVVDTAGAEHRLHFRRDTRAEFHRLYEELAAAVAAARRGPADQESGQPERLVDLTDPTTPPDPPDPADPADPIQPAAPADADGIPRDDAVPV